ncbi:MAG TPA: DUF484 domain-containing protein [Sphingomicrobium sp.]|nr:DUF484 domain-containing protein [Sphingomicrobium sp.]
MAQVISFEETAVARLRERLGAAEEANQDLIAFARGQSDAVLSINAAVLAAIEAPSIHSLFDVITGQWPAILGIDFVAVAMIVGDRGFRADCNSLERVEAALVERMVQGLPKVEVRSVPSGHPLFGAPANRKVRAEALIRIDGPPPFPRGLLVLGQTGELAADSSHGSSLLLFLGQVVAATVRRCVATA